MLVLGLLLILGAGVVTAGALLDAGETASVEILGQTLTTTAAGVFVIGALTMLVFLLGVWALMASMSRGRRKRVERKQARNRHRDSVKSLEEERESLRLENERLAEQLHSRQTAGAGAAGAAGGAATAGAMSDDDYSTDRTRHDRDGDGVDDRAETRRSTSAAGADGQRSFMDRVTGRHTEQAGTTDAGSTTDSYGSTGSIGSTDSYSSTGSTESTDGHRSDRVIDHDTDLRANESTTASHNREI